MTASSGSAIASWVGEASRLARVVGTEPRNQGFDSLLLSAGRNLDRGARRGASPGEEEPLD
jgi:hypothetical protein